MTTVEFYTKRLHRAENQTEPRIGIATAVMVALGLAVIAVGQMNNPSHSLFDSRDTAHPDSVEMLPEIMRQHYRHGHAPEA